MHECNANCTGCEKHKAFETLQEQSLNKNSLHTRLYVRNAAYFEADALQPMQTMYTEEIEGRGWGGRRREGRGSGPF